MRQTSLAAVLAPIVVGAVVAACGGSKDSPSAPAQSQNPQIVACNSVSYKGTTFTGVGCAPGIAAFDVTISQNGVTGKFHVTCSNGCISSVTAT